MNVLFVTLHRGVTNHYHYSWITSMEFETIIVQKTFGYYVLIVIVNRIPMLVKTKEKWHPPQELNLPTEIWSLCRQPWNMGGYIKLVAPRGIEPTICRLKVYRPKPLDDEAIKLVLQRGVEPRTQRSQRCVINPFSPPKHKLVVPLGVEPSSPP